MTSQAHGIALTTTANGQNNKKGMKILVSGANVFLNSATKEGSVSATTTCYLLDASLAIITAGSAWSGNVSSFSGAVQLDASTAYYIVVEGSSQTYRYNGEGGGLTYPYLGTLVSWTAGVDTGNDEAQKAWNIESIDVAAPASATVTPSALALSLALPAASAVVNDTVLPSALALTLTLNSPLAKSNVSQGTIRSDAGSVGMTPVRAEYPVVEGLIATTTKQTKNPNL